MAMSLRTATLIQDVRRVHQETGWTDVARGLTITLRGYFLLTAGVLAGLALLGWWEYQTAMYNQSATRAPDSLNAWQAAGVAALLFGPAVGCVLVLLGQWRCLLFITERHGAKSLIFACIVCLCLTLFLSIVTVSVSVGENAKVLDSGWPGWSKLEFHWATTIAQVTSAGFVLLNILLFTYFIRAIVECFEDHRRAQRVDRYVLFTGFLLGGTLFLVLGNLNLTSQPGYLLGMAGCWLLYFIYHVKLVWSARACIRDNGVKLLSPVGS